MSDDAVLARTSKTPLATRWRAVPRWVQIVVVFAAACVLYQFVASTVSGVTGSSNHVTGSASTLDDSATGVAAYDDLLAESGYHVTTLTSPLPTPASAPTGNLLVLDPTQWTPSQSRAVAALVRGGSTVVVSGETASTGVLQALGAARGVAWMAGPAGRITVVRSALWSGAPGVIDSPTVGHFTVGPAASSAVLAGAAADALVVGVHVRGWLFAVASSSALDNANLARADNAGLALALADSTSRRVTFDEYVHGIGRGGSGLAGLPAPWRFGLGLAVLGLLIGLVSSARRFGPVQRAARALIPPRVLYVDAMATHLSTLATAEVVAASEPVTRSARATLAARLSVPVTASNDELRAAATRSPVHAAALGAITSRLSTPAHSTADLVALGHAAAALAHSTFDDVSNGE